MPTHPPINPLIQSIRCSASKKGAKPKQRDSKNVIIKGKRLNIFGSILKV
tara:strand:+ start:46 stop:195 length:150 start_codon:yes stop_codon:yes gene_type:complete